MSDRLDHKKFATAVTIPDGQYVLIREMNHNGFKPWQASEALYGQPRHPYVTAVYFIEAHAKVSHKWMVSDLIASRRAAERAADRIDGYDRDDLGESPDW